MANDVHTKIANTLMEPRCLRPLVAAYFVFGMALRPTDRPWTKSCNAPPVTLPFRPGHFGHPFRTENGRFRLSPPPVTLPLLPDDVSLSFDLGLHSRPKVAITP